MARAKLHYLPGPLLNYMVMVYFEFEFTKIDIMQLLLKLATIYCSVTLEFRLRNPRTIMTLVKR